MDKGIKVSSPGHDINGDNNSKPFNGTPKMEPYLIASVAIAFVYGAEMALRRYVVAAEATKQDTNHIFECIYETSNLVENLDILDHYMSMCGQTLNAPFNIRVIRNHIRHDHRENLTAPDNAPRTRRADALGVDNRLLVSMGFEPQMIKIGSTLLSISDARAFIEEASKYFHGVTQVAIDKGLIKGARISPT